jgi:hypothetical protein
LVSKPFFGKFAICISENQQLKFFLNNLMDDDGDKRKMIKLLDSNSINMVFGGRNICCCHGPDSAYVLGVTGVTSLCNLALRGAQGTNSAIISTSINGRQQSAVVIDFGLDAMAAEAGESPNAVCSAFCGYHIPAEQPGMGIRYSTLGATDGTIVFWAPFHFSLSLEIV